MSTVFLERARKTRRVALVALLAMLAVLVPRPMPRSSGAPAFVEPDVLRAPGRAVAVIVQAVGSDARRVARVVDRLGGHVTRDLPIIGGFAATVPHQSLAKLAQTEGVRAISLDRKVQVQGTGASGPNDVYAQAIRATDVQRTGDNGAGVTVALVDTGIANLADVAGRVLPVTTDPAGLVTAPCENLSGETDCTDSYGHGTFIAGLIAGNGAASGGQYTGVAPKANLVSVKIAGRDGSADVSNVLAAIQWVVSFKDKYNIRVLNLSLGTDSSQTYHLDPLDFAVEQAWSAGIVVVVSASNRGPAPGTISKPGDDPWVITVGAIDDRGTPGPGDDELPNFTGRGPTSADGLAKPDVVAPGAHVISLAAPGSSISTQFPSSMAAPYRRGSGTSMATGIVSGSVALMLSANPTMTPDRVKYALTSTARPDASTDRMAVGSGIIDAYGATFSAPAGLANQGLGRSSGTGSLQASRGTVSVQLSASAGGVVVSGNLTTQLTTFDPLNYTTVSWTGSSWYGSSWYGSSWYGSSWYGSSWYGSSWYGSSWYGQPDGSSWYGSSWYGSSWYGAWDQ